MLCYKYNTTQKQNKKDPKKLKTLLKKLKLDKRVER